MLIVAFCCVLLMSVLLIFVLNSDSFRQNIYEIILPIYIGVVVIVLVSCRLAAGRLTKKITGSMNRAIFDEDSVVYDELSPFIRYIQDQKAQLNERLDEILKEKTLLEALSKSMNEGLILVDGDGGMQSINRSAHTILGIDESYIGKNILEAIRHVDIPEHLNQALSGRSNEWIHEISARTYQILFSPADNGVLILFLDITEKAEAEKLRREFSANVSHELKTPLTIISGYADLIENGLAKNEDIIGMAEKIKNESARLVTLIEDIIKLSQLDESNGSKNYSGFDLAELAREAADSLKERASGANIAIEVPDAPVIVTANRDMMFELLYNLIDNGIKYNKPDGKIKIDLIQNHDKTNILVTDTGIGIERKHLDRIFERFYRVDPSRSKKTGGTGLGLSIVKHIVAFHGGTISVKSKPDVGTTIHISF